MMCVCQNNKVVVFVSSMHRPCARARVVFLFVVHLKVVIAPALQYPCMLTRLFSLGTYLKACFFIGVGKNWSWHD